MTLKKFNEILEKSKESTYKTIEQNPDEVDYALSYFQGHFMAALTYELFKSKSKYCGYNKNIEKAAETWLKTEHEIKTLKYKEEFLDIVKQFLNRR